MVDAFNQARTALFYHSWQHRHARTQRMIRYYFAAQDIHERANSTHLIIDKFLNNSKYRFNFSHSALARITSASLSRYYGLSASKYALSL